MDRACGGKLYHYLRRSRFSGKRYRRRSSWQKYADRIPITQRCREANDRTEIGHWERDLICGGVGRGALLTIVDRKSRYTKLAHLNSFKPSEVNQATAQALKNKICYSITNDNGVEFEKFECLGNTLKTKIFFTTPYSSWERGSVENMNGLIRQLFPKKYDFKNMEHWKIAKAEDLLNLRPRKTLGWRTPHEVFFGEALSLIKESL